MQLSLNGIKDGAFAEKGYALPKFDIDAMREATRNAPEWMHIGGGNIMRAFLADIAQKLLNAGDMKTGMIVVKTHNEAELEKVFTRYDNLSVSVALKNDGTVDKTVLASIAEALGYERDFSRVEEIAKSDSLKVISFTITEKGYSVDKNNIDSSVIAKVARLLNARYIAGGKPVALVSFDNCAHNGSVLKNAVNTVVNAWLERGDVDAGFVEWLNSGAVAFPWTMIDKITPRASQTVLDMLKADGLEGIEIDSQTSVSAMVNAEECGYLAIEDNFPNGRFPFEKAGVLFGTAEDIDKIEKMKVCTCLNPLHTCLAIFGCMLGYTRICDEMKDADLVALINHIGWNEGMPVVTDPGVMKAEDFLNEVLNKRFPNPFVPDTPQRIATDTSKKIPVRYGETLKGWIRAGKNDLSFLNGIPTVFAGYARYLTGIGDDGKPFEISSDPNLAELQKCVEGFELGKPFDTGKLRPLFSREDIFGVNLYEYGLGEKAEKIFARMNVGAGAIREEIVKGAKA